jgi:ADP-ribose pyrophosphatase YjhB (NUDIX family)
MGERPQLAVSAVIFRDGQVLLVRRAREPGRGLYSVPGGRVEHGETLHEAVAREVREETSLSIGIADFAGWREVLPNPAAGQPGHYLVISFAAHWRDGSVSLNEELDDFRWIFPDTLPILVRTGEIATTQGLPGIIEAARRLISPR